MDERRVDPAVQLIVDEMILDYLVFATTKHLLQKYIGPDEGLENSSNDLTGPMLLQLVDSFIAMFRVMHPDQHGDMQLRFRLRLLSFTVMFTKRSAPSEATPSASALQKLREKRQRQASRFRSSQGGVGPLGLPDLTVHISPSDVMAIKEEPDSQSDRSITREEPSCSPVSLLDTLPAFMALSAAQNAMQEITTITDRWMHLAASYMAHAVVEQYLEYGSTRPEVIQEAFAWGFDAECDSEEGSDEWQINAMFFGEDGVVEGWERVRNEHIQALVPPDGVDLRNHLHSMIKDDLSITKFEEYVLSFLMGLHLSQTIPILMQVESGKIEGLSRRAVQSLQRAIGLL